MFLRLKEFQVKQAERWKKAPQLQPTSVTCCEILIVSLALTGDSAEMLSETKATVI